MRAGAPGIGDITAARVAPGPLPLGEGLGIGPGQSSDGLQKGLCRLGAELSFGAAAETFTALTGVPVSPREAERLTEGRGATTPWRECAAPSPWGCATPSTS